MAGETFRSGDMAGPYEILELIGVGGHAEVYRARGCDGQLVAIKVLQVRYRGLKHLQVRFLSEGRVMQVIDDVHVVRFLDFGVTDESVPWFAMELLEGRLLRDYLHDEGGRLDVGRALRFGRQIAQGAEAGHRHRVYHRDLKLENVMIVEGDIAKIFDFGIAKLKAWGNKTTQPGEAWGTPLYMAPEQFEGGEVDERTDVYAVGLVLYELIAGQYAFALRDGSNPTRDQLPEMQKRGPRPLTEVEPEVEDYVWEVIAKALAWAPNDRWKDMVELGQAAGEALKRWRKDHRTSVVPAPIATPAPVPKEPRATAEPEQEAGVATCATEPAPAAPVSEAQGAAEPKKFVGPVVTEQIVLAGGAAPARAQTSAILVRTERLAYLAVPVRARRDAARSRAPDTSALQALKAPRGPRRKAVAGAVGPREARERTSAPQDPPAERVEAPVGREAAVGSVAGAAGPAGRVSRSSA